MNNKCVAINQFLSVQNCTSWFFEMRLLIFQVLLLDLSIFLLSYLQYLNGAEGECFKKIISSTKNIILLSLTY